MPRLHRTAAVVAVAAIGLTACSGEADPVGPSASAPADEAVPGDESEDAAPEDEATDDDAVGASDDGAEVVADDAPAGTPIEVDATALPSEPAGYEPLAEDLCQLWSVEQLDAFFGGAGELAISEPQRGGCRWAVEGLPRSHYVEATVTDDAGAFGVEEGDRLTLAGVEVHLQRGFEDAWATMPTPDGRYVAIRVHGDFGVELRAIDGGLDPAATALAENLAQRL